VICTLTLRDHSILCMLQMSFVCEEVTAPSMQASAESRVTRPPHARLRMQAKLAPPTVLVRKADVLYWSDVIFICCTYSLAVTQVWRESTACMQLYVQTLLTWTYRELPTWSGCDWLESLMPCFNLHWTCLDYSQQP
jgi:hypothetical protein